MSTGTTAVESLLKHERYIIFVGLALLTALSWLWVLIGSGTGMSAASMSTWSFPPPVDGPVTAQWTVGRAIIMLFMWWIMMIAMMTPSAAPTILLYAQVYRYERKLGRITGVATPTFAFALGYLLAWMGFSLAATGLQWGLERAGLVHAMMMWSVEPVFSAALLLAAGVYQLTALKNICLNHCRSPARFLAANFRPGVAGAIGMGLKHGAFCVGCCWMLMALLFAGGIMNLVWIAGLAILVLAEKILPMGALIARLSGVAMMGMGLFILGRPYLV